MTQAIARREIATAIETARLTWVGFPLLVEQENRTVIDHATQVNPYVAVDVLFDDADQLDLGPSPLQRVLGRVYLCVAVKEGEGVAKSTQVMEHMIKSLSFKAWTLVQTKVASPRNPVARKGWYCLLTTVDFWYHEPVNN